MREILLTILNKYFEIGDSDTYCLTRDKSAFAIGTMSIDDFEEYSEENTTDIVDYILKELPKPGETIYRVSTEDEDKYVEPFTIDNIVICEDGEVLLKYDSWDGVICTLDNLMNGTLYLDDYRVFDSKEIAEAWLEGVDD